MPPGLELIPIDRAHRAARRRASGEGVILEAFKPGTAPPSTYSIIGYQDSMGVPHRRVSPEADRAVATGTGGLY